MADKTSGPGRGAERALTALTVLILLGFFAVFSIINFAGFADFAPTDMYEDTLVAKLMWEQKTLFPYGYTFGNQYYIIATPVLAALFYGLTGSLNTGMALATALMSALILLAFIYMLRPFVKNTLALAGGLLTLAACVFTPHAVAIERAQLFFLMCSFYACYTVTLFFVFGDYMRARSSPALRPAAFALSLLLSFCTGMQSLRQTCIMTLPLLAFEFIQLIRRRADCGKFVPAGERMPLLRTGAYLTANLLGVLLSKLLEIPHETIYTGKSLLGGATLSEKLSATKNAVFSITGLETVAACESTLFTAMFVFYLLIFLAAALIILAKPGAVPQELRGLWWLCMISIGAVIAASVFSSVSLRDIYLFVYYPLLALSFITVFGFLKGRMRGALTGLLCIFALCNIFASYGEDVKTALDKTPSPAQQICEYALENGYKYIYGCHASAAPSVAVHSDGKLIAGTWEDDVIFKVMPYINIQTIYSLEDYSKALFVFRPQELEPARTETEANGTKLTVVGTYGDLTVCTSDKQLMYPLTWPHQWPKLQTINEK